MESTLERKPTALRLLTLLGAAMPARDFLMAAKGDAIQKVAAGATDSVANSLPAGYAVLSGLSGVLVWQRVLADDYPNGAVIDEAGCLPVDVDGRPLTASPVAARRRAFGLETLSKEGRNSRAKDLRSIRAACSRGEALVYI
ncbi:MAG: hypothetical protein FD153_1941 [Rhodospirillaceae bacterium]|nr:MAG: hypothetical protein FD153_1941 [Rhodospirillaceae bacterium]